MEDAIRDSRLETPWIFPGFCWYDLALDNEVAEPGRTKAAKTVQTQIIRQHGFSDAVKKALADGESVNILALEDARRFRYTSFPENGELDRNGDWVSMKRTA